MFSRHQAHFLAPLSGSQKLQQGEFHTSNLITLFLSCLVYFYFILFDFNYQKHKKIEFLHLAYFGLLLCLVLYLLSMVTFFETSPTDENNMRELYKIYLELGHEVFEEKIKKPMDFMCMMVAMLLL